MKILIVEDDFISRKTLQHLVKPYGKVDVAANGTEGIEAFKLGLTEKEAYDLIFLDIMMPDLSGQEVLREIRKIEEKAHIVGLERSKVIMTTALDDKQNIMDAFKGECEAYMIKPITFAKLEKQLQELNLI